MTTPWHVFLHSDVALAISEGLRFNDICCFVHASAAHRCFIATLTPSKREEQRLINIAEKEDKEKKKTGRKRRKEPEENRVRKLTKWYKKRERIRIRRAAFDGELERLRMAALFLTALYEQANLMPPSHLRPP